MISRKVIIKGYVIVVRFYQTNFTKKTKILETVELP